MAIGRKWTLIFGVATTVAFVLALSVQLSPAPHLAVLSEKTAENISEYSYTNSTLNNVHGLNLSAIGASSFESIECYSSGSSPDVFNDVSLYFNSSLSAGKMFSSVSSNLTGNPLIPTHHSEYRDFEFIYAFPHHFTSQSSPYYWDICGLNSHYLFIIDGYSESFPIENMTTIAHEQINVMETPLL